MSKNKKVNGFTIEYDKESNLFLVKDRQGYTAKSKPSIGLALEWAKKDRRYVGYEASIGGLVSKKSLDKKDKNQNKKLIKNIRKLNYKLKKDN